jgi:hypothetical protein
MLPLDSRTAERVAKLICDPNGPFERTGREMERLLHNAGWSDPPEYDASPRVPWFTEALEDRRHDHTAVERLLCRICDPLEYDDGSTSADIIRAELNRILEPEQLIVSTVAGRPVLAQLGAHDSVPVFTAPEELDQRLRRLIRNQAMVELLLDRISQACICENSKAYLLSVIGIGSFVEGLLFAVLTERDTDLRDRGFPNRKGGRTPSKFAGLELLIEAAQKKRWIQIDAKDFVDKVRDYRNFVHPRHQLDLGFSPDADTLMMCWAPVRALLNDLEVALLPKPSSGQRPSQR